MKAREETTCDLSELTANFLKDESLSYVIRPDGVEDRESALDEYTHALWAASLEPRQFCVNNREVLHLYKDLLTKTVSQTWFEKVNDGDGRAAYLLLREHYAGEAHDQRCAASAMAKLKILLWNNVASFPFEKYLTLNEAFMEMEELNSP